ncbi:MAG: RNA-binding transcriptional accessory protein, partial [Desulfobacteraceae bacterium]
MDARHLLKIAAEGNVQAFQVNATAELLAGGATVPFIARYRKEATGTLDEVAITFIRDRLHQLEELDQRRESILKSLRERELLTPELEEKITAAETMSTLEDIYLPFRPKKRTRATVAREKGLESLAQTLFEQADAIDPQTAALAFIDPEKGVASAEEALAGARDIMAEWVNENQEARARMRALFEKKAVVRSKVITGKEAEGAKFRDYFQWEEPVAGAPSHRILAVRRGENEGFLDLSMFPGEEEALQVLESLFLKADNRAALQVKEAVIDSYKRLLSYAMETDLRLETKKRADSE